MEAWARSPVPRPAAGSPGSRIRPKQRRITQACDFCHRRGVKCRAGGSGHAGDSVVPTSPCLTCLEFGQPCTRNRQQKKRGVKARSASGRAGHSRRPALSPTPPTPPCPDQPFASIASFTPGSHTSSPRLRNRKVITALLDVYLDTVHPTFPIYCEREIWVRWRDGSFPAGPEDYMSLMCMCALSAHHVGHGALFTDEEDDGVSGSPSAGSLLTEDDEHADAPLADLYRQEAIRLVPVDFRAAPSVDLIRSYGFLALLGAHSGHSGMAHQYLGLYHGVCGQLGLHDEHKWAPGLCACETEVRRHIWWAMYRLEVHTACVFGSLVRASETQCNVGYPAGIHHPPFIPGRDGQYEDWFSGWNATTDLYRVLEHAVREFRAQRPGTRQSVLGPDTGSRRSAAVAQRLAQIQQALMPQFEAAASRSADSGRNRCGFQTANLLCTVHLARMMLSLSEDATLATVLPTAQCMMDAMSAIPPEYVRALGSTLLQQLAGVGHMLAGVARKQAVQALAGGGGSGRPVQDYDYGQLRGVLVAMAAFVAQFNRHHAKIATAAQQRLTAEVADLDARVGSLAWQNNDEANDADAALQNDCLLAASHGSGQAGSPDFSAGDADVYGMLSGDLLSSFMGQYLQSDDI